MRGILPENNPGIRLIPQILTRDAEDFLKWERDMRAFGYTELNINIGCPSGTVVSKDRGAGFLRHPEKIDAFLCGVFEKTECSVSVKTRLGMDSAEEFDRILEVYNKYPLKELIIHARTGAEVYSGIPHRDIYEAAVKKSRNPVVYNGDIWTVDDAEKIDAATDCLMLGRGMVADPALIRKLRGGAPMQAEELTVFLETLEREYLSCDPDPAHTVSRMKEVWTLLQRQFPDHPKEVRQLMKAARLEELRLYERMLTKAYAESRRNEA